MTRFGQWVWAWGAVGVLAANGFRVLVDAGDVARALHRLSDEDWFDMELLRDWPALGALGTVEPGPMVPRLGTGDPLRLYVRGHIGDVAALELAVSVVRARHYADVAKHLTARCAS